MASLILDGFTGALRVVCPFNELDRTGPRQEEVKKVHNPSSQLDRRRLSAVPHC